MLRAFIPTREKKPWAGWENAGSASTLLGLPWVLLVAVMTPEPCLPSLHSCTLFHLSFLAIRVSIYLFVSPIRVHAPGGQGLLSNSPLTHGTWPRTAH